MFNLMSRMARDFDQVLISFTEQRTRPAPELLEVCAEVVLVHRVGSHLQPRSKRPAMVEEFASPAFAASLELAVRKWRPVAVQLEYTQMAQYARFCCPAKTILVEHDITMELYDQMVQLQPGNGELRREHRLWTRYETDAWGKMDVVVAMSDRDKGLVKARETAVIKNGVDLVRFQPTNDDPEPGRILFVGSFAHFPNLLAINFFLREVWDLLAPFSPQLHIIAGPRYREALDRYKDLVTVDLDRPGIHVEAFVKDVRSAYRSASVVIAPLVASAGTNIKVMEAMAMGKAIVATPAGINGLDELTPGRDVLVATTGPDMADAIRSLLSVPRLRHCLEHRARRTAERHYDWDEIARRQGELYQALSSRSAVGGGHETPQGF